MTPTASSRVSSRLLGLLMAVIVGGCTASASIGPAPAGGTPATASAGTAAPAPATAEGCKACNGIWGMHGLSQTASCNCRTTDGGKRCRDGGECQGICVAADQPEREVVEAGPPQRGYFVGKCSETVAIYGCYKPIEKGASSKGPIPMTEIPASLCAD